MNDWNTINNPLWPWVCDWNKQGCLKLLHGICFNPIAMGLFLTQPMATPAHCRCLGLCPSTAHRNNQIQMGGSLPITNEMHARNHSVRIPTCAHWHPNQLASKHSRQPFRNSADSEVHVVHLSVTVAYTLESLSSFTKITHNLQATVNFMKRGNEKEQQ